MNRRGVAAGVVLGAWAVGLGVLVKREYFRPHMERLAEAAMRVSPGAVFYGVTQGDRQIGFASSTIDTAANAILAKDYLVADVPVGGRVHRATAKTDVELTRALRIRRFTFTLQADAPPIRATGEVVGDTVLVLAIASGQGAAPDTQRIHLDGPVLLPTLIPLTIALGERPSVGKTYNLPMFDPIGMVPKQTTFRVTAESSFVVNDSAAFDSTTRRWRGVLPDTIKAWRISGEQGSTFSGWVDEQGRVVSTTQLGFDLRRLPYELAFENWRIDERERGTRVTEDRDILETTAIAADKSLRGGLPYLRVRLSNVDLAGFDLNGDRQALRGDTLTIARESDSSLVAKYALPLGGRRLLRAYTRPEPLIQVGNVEIVQVMQRIVGSETNPRVVAERINRWVHDSVVNHITFGIPNALEVLHTRRGDCNEHTQLYVALARSAGIPTRIAAGLGFIDGKFYYHAWPEVYLNGWVAVDPTFGQFPADAAHLRFTIGGLGRQADLLRLMGNLHIDVLR
jgi:transglutaminase superfamily protein